MKKRQKKKNFHMWFVKTGYKMAIKGEVDLWYCGEYICLNKYSTMSSIFRAVKKARKKIRYRVNRINNQGCK